MSGDWVSDPHGVCKDFSSPSGFERRSFDEEGRPITRSDTSEEHFPTLRRPAAFIEGEPKASEAAIQLAGPTEPGARTSTSGLVIQPPVDANIDLTNLKDPGARTATSGIVIQPNTGATQDATLCSEVSVPLQPVSCEERLYRAPMGQGRAVSEASCLASELEELSEGVKGHQGIGSPTSVGSEVGALRDFPSLQKERGKLNDLARRRAASLDTAQLRAQKVRSEE